MRFEDAKKAIKVIDVFIKDHSHWMSAASFTWLLVSITGNDEKAKKALRLTSGGESKDYPISDEHAEHISSGKKAKVTMGCGKTFEIN